MLRKLWLDEGGAIVSAEIVVVMTILVIGVITGLSSLRDAVITELADVGGAIAWLDQSYILHGSNAHSSATANTIHMDTRDYCDDGETTTAERGLVICGGAFVEGVASTNEGMDQK
jgi:hypothetical protein